MKSLDLNLLSALSALLTEGSVTGAARVMNLSTPAMSHALARIRQVVGDPILVRAGRTLVPTPRALEMREPARRLVAEARELLLPGEGVQFAGVEREFVVRAPDGIPIIYGSTLLEALHETMPLVSLRFVPESGSDSLALREGRIDVDIGALHDKMPEIRAEPLFEHRYVGVVRIGHPLRRGRMSIERFAGQKHVALMQRGQSRESVDVAFAATGHVRKISLTVPGAYGALMAAARSDLVATVPARTAQSVASTLGLSVFALPFDVPVDSVVLAWHPRSHYDAAHEVLRRCVKRVLLGKLPTGKPVGAEALHRQTLSDIRISPSIEDE